MRKNDSPRAWCPKVALALVSAVATACLVGCGMNSETSASQTQKTGTQPAVVVAESAPAVVVVRTPAAEPERTPTVVAQAAAREAAKQDGTWTSENIQKNPYLFIQDQIRNCDQLKAKIEAQNITMTRLGKQAVRSIEEADAMTARYTAFLQQAKAAYKEAEASGNWPDRKSVV